MLRLRIFFLFAYLLLGYLRERNDIEINFDFLFSYLSY